MLTADMSLSASLCSLTRETAPFLLKFDLDGRTVRPGASRGNSVATMDRYCSGALAAPLRTHAVLPENKKACAVNAAGSSQGLSGTPDEQQIVG